MLRGLEARSRPVGITCRANAAARGGTDDGTCGQPSAPGPSAQLKRYVKTSLNFPRPQLAAFVRHPERLLRAVR